MKFCNKKAMVLILVFAILLVFIIMPMLYLKLDSKRTSFNGKIGELQYTILDTIQMQEEKIFYIKESARYSTYIALNQLEEKGGYSHNSPCGISNGYRLWQDQTKECAPTEDDILYNSQELISSTLNHYMAKNNLSLDNYDYFIKENNGSFRLVGTALQNINSDIIYYNTKVGEYSIKPSFDIAFDYDLAFYQELKALFFGYNGILVNVTKCETERGFQECMQESFNAINPTSNFTLEINCDGKDSTLDRVLVICATKKGKEYVIPDATKGTVSKPQKVTFALYVRKPAAAAVQEVSATFEPSSDNCAILSWRAAKNAVSQYLLFYSKDFSLNTKQIENGEILSNGIKTEKRAISSEKALFFDSFNPLCVFSQLDASCSHETIKGGVSNLERFSENSLVFSKGVFYYKLCNLESKKYSFFLTSDPIDNVTVENAIEVVPKDKLALGKVDFTLMSGTTSLIVALNNPLKNIDGSDGGTDLQKYYVFAKSDTCEGLIDAKYYREVKATEDSIELNTVGSEAVSLGKTYCVGVLAVDTDNNPVNVVFVSHTEKRIDVVPEYTHIINELAHPQMITLS